MSNVHHCCRDYDPNGKPVLPAKEKWSCRSYGERYIALNMPETSLPLIEKVSLIPRVMLTTTMNQAIERPLLCVVFWNRVRQTKNAQLTLSPQLQLHDDDARFLVVLRARGAFILLRCSFAAAYRTVRLRARREEFREPPRAPSHSLRTTRCSCSISSVLPLVHTCCWGCC